MNENESNTVMATTELAELRREAERIVAKWRGQAGARDNAAYRLAEQWYRSRLAAALEPLLPEEIP